MRIFCAVRHSHDPSQFYGGLWSGNFYPAIQRLGHEIVESQVDLFPASRFMQVSDGFTPQEEAVRSGITQQIVSEVQAEHRRQPIDLFLSYFYNAHFDPAGFDDIHRLGIPTVNFYCNGIYQFELVAAIAAKALWSWHAEKHSRKSYLAAGGRPVWVQMAADPGMYHPIAQVKRQSKCCFVGQRYADRDRWVHELSKRGVPLDVYGSGWNSVSNKECSASVQPGSQEFLGRRVFANSTPRSYLRAVRQNLSQQGVIAGTWRSFRQWQYRNQSRRISPHVAHIARGPVADICKTFAEYEIVLNFSNVWGDGRPGSALVPHVRLRDFEAPLCRTCYFTGHSEEIAEFYDIGREIDTYRTPEELIEKTRFYLSHPEAAERLREKGYQRALRDHTWDCRFQQLFREVGLSAATTPSSKSC